MTKSSSDREQLARQYLWYAALPVELACLCPRVVSYSNDGAEATLALECIGAPPLEVAWLEESLSPTAWQELTARLCAMLACFRAYKGHLDPADFEAVYRTKLQSRLAKLQGAPWDTLLTAPVVWVNHVPLLGYPALEPGLFARTAALYNPTHVTLLHGDYHLGNILHDQYLGLLSLVDPRGNFGRDGNLGDSKYDLAKLLHSFEGGYHSIVNDRFSVSLDRARLTLDIFTPAVQPTVVEWFTAAVQSAGFAIQELRLIEGLLFLSMLPLHADHPRRQLAMFARAVQLLNAEPGGAL